MLAAHVWACIVLILVSDLGLNQALTSDEVLAQTLPRGAQLVGTAA